MEKAEGEWTGSSNKEQEGTYQASCMNSMEEKKSHGLRGLQGKQHPQARAQFPFKLEA